MSNHDVLYACHIDRLVSCSQAVTARYNKDLYLAFQLHLEAGEHSVAHEIVVRELAPEAILRQDVELLRRLLQDFDVRAVENWESGGQVSTFFKFQFRDVTETLGCLQVFMEYAECVQGLQGPSSEIRRLEPIVAGLIHSVPRLVERGGKGMKLRMCIAEMQSQLLSFSSRLYPVRFSPILQIVALLSKLIFRLCCLHLSLSGLERHQSSWQWTAGSGS